ncbi:cell division suppressor protein YneA [Bacillus sonorensis]|uniref:Cell division suppressor protein YneA n=2 Tax=Bacillus sonorensis TaxID=119858 RepID=M5P6K2_9BACI|nr:MULTISPECIES: cell division suppressor protein YneA [Bacillus]ASB89126.1 Cell division suppressor protein YneA [Bacillus sonorensis]EME75646.1 cell division suppressor protein YneA [Bacillus sonorensis L12]MBG9915086.1 peptidoglycan-binding protein [Bacillus sonorensis]MCF7618469.1 cell division suppressor protein YneA [Bacillus sonorensis]MCY7859446.1 cell division suppressor protein YneA [Bacillus sonorensis]
MKKESFIFVSLFTVGISICILFMSFAAKIEENKQYVKIEVQEGDSLWGLADRIQGGKAADRQKFIEWVAEQNDLPTSVIQPGDVLVVPVTKQHSDQYQLAVVE